MPIRGKLYFMKLRIRGNAIRLRLTKTEVENLKTHGSLEEKTEFPDGERLVYSICADENSRDITAKFIAGKIMISFSKSIAENWADSDETGIYGGDGNLQIAIEKDFKCLTPRSGDDDQDTFPHPKEGSNNC